MLYLLSPLWPKFSMFGMACALAFVARYLALAVAARSQFSMAEPSSRWHFHDFGARQWVQDAATGECLLAHATEDAVFDGGPFRFTVEDGRPVLIGLEGSENDCALHFADDHFSRTVFRKKNPTSGEDECMVADKHMMQDGQWLLDIAHDYTPQALVMDVTDNQKSFRAEFAWYTVPTQCGDKPVKLRMGMSWLYAYLFDTDKEKYNGTRRNIECQKELELFGLHEAHFIHSNLSRKRKCGAAGVATSTVEESARYADCQVSMAGVILYLLNVVAKAANTAATSQSGDDVLRRGGALLEAIIEWPLLGSGNIAFSCDRSEFDVLLLGTCVDMETLQASETQGRRPKAHHRSHKIVDGII